MRQTNYLKVKRVINKLGKLLYAEKWCPKCYKYIVIKGNPPDNVGYTRSCPHDDKDIDFYSFEFDIRSLMNKLLPSDSDI